MYHVFLGAPSAKLLQSSKTEGKYTWTTISSTRNEKEQASTDILPPPATLEAASHRISLMYQNAIFQDDDEKEEELVRESLEEHQDGSTLITWPPTAAEGENSIFRTGMNRTRSFMNMTSHLETQETQESQSFNYSDSSSIARFPNFHFNLHSVTSLATVRKTAESGKTNQDYPFGYSNKINVLLAVLEVDGPDTIRTKKGPDAGKDISIMKMILGDENGNVCKLTAWRETADVWGGLDSKHVAVKRGDVVFIANVTTSLDTKTSPTLTASPNLSSRLEICYRSMPYAHEDLRLRPDLRLGGSDARIRKVASVVRWFERMAGISAE